MYLFIEPISYTINFLLEGFTKHYSYFLIILIRVAGQLAEGRQLYSVQNKKRSRRLIIAQGPWSVGLQMLTSVAIDKRVLSDRR